MRRLIRPMRPVPFAGSKLSDYYLCRCLYPNTKKTANAPTIVAVAAMTNTTWTNASIGIAAFILVLPCSTSISAICRLSVSRGCSTLFIVAGTPVAIIGQRDLVWRRNSLPFIVLCLQGGYYLEFSVDNSPLDMWTSHHSG